MLPAGAEQDRNLRRERGQTLKAGPLIHFEHHVTSEKAKVVIKKDG